MRHIARLFLVTDFAQKSINPKIASSVSCLRRHRFPWHHHDTETESRYVRVDGRPGSSFLLSQPLNPPDGVTASLFTSVASSAPLLTSNQTCSDARYLWIVCVSLIAANHSKYRCACVFSPFHLFPVVGRELQNPHLLVFLSRKMENTTDLNSCCCFSAHRQIWAQIPEFMCTESFLQLFPQIESTLRTPCRSLKSRTSMWIHDSVLTLSLKPCLVSLLLTSMAHFQNPPCGRPSWVRSVFSCLFMIWFTLTYFHILFGCSVSFTGLK